MHRLARRQLLKTTGVGVALGMGTAGARKQVTAQQSGGSFTATATDGFLTINAGVANPGEEAQGTRLPLAGSGIDGDFTIEGTLAGDGTWESTSTSLPSFSETRDSGNIIVGDITISVDYSIDGKVTGTIDRSAGTMTAEMPLRIDLEVSDFPGGPAGGVIAADANNLTTGTSNGSGTTRGMQGSASNLDTGTGTATLVDNKLTLPGTGTDLVDGTFNLPSNTSGRNWMELQFSLALPENTAPGTFQGTVTDSDGNPLSGATVEVVDDGTTVSTATTDGSGAYSVNAPPGTYDITATASNHKPNTKLRSITEGASKTVDFSLSEGTANPGTVTGTILDWNGSLLSGQEVKLVQPGQTVATTTTDAAGLYALTVAPGDYQLVVERQARETVRQSVTVEANASTTVDITLARLPYLTSNPVADPDGDGLYEDVRGDGGVSVLDVQTLFNNLDNPQLQSNAEKFDFSGTGGNVTVLDVQALFNMTR